MAHQAHIADLFLELDGLMSFEQYMKEALYHPRYGYYASNIATVGRRGDFSTSATISDTLAKVLCQWALNERSVVWDGGIGSRWHVIEIGAGDGSLARDFMSHLGKLRGLFLTYHVVEVSEALRSLQREKLGSKAKWHETVEDALQACDGQALILSNELVDAFPATVVRWNGGQRVWEELYLRDCGVNGLAEEFKPLNSKKQDQGSSIMGAWDSEHLALEDRQRCEVLWSYEAWQGQWLPQLKKGSVLTVDYGAAFPKLYHKRPNGTLRGYFQGVRVEGMEIFDRFGHQDLTTDVNFSDLQMWGERSGLETIKLTAQRTFLTEMMPELQDFSLQQQDPALEFLMSPYGAGNAFQVLQQRKVGV